MRLGALLPSSGTATDLELAPCPVAWHDDAVDVSEARSGPTGGTVVNTLIAGVACQDRAYLARLLLADKCTVPGACRGCVRDLPRCAALRWAPVSDFGSSGRTTRSAIVHAGAAARLRALYVGADLQTDHHIWLSAEQPCTIGASGQTR